VTEWELDQIPDQAGRTVIITGATGGIGQHLAIELARRGARVVLAGRNQARLDQTARWLVSEVPGTDVHQLLVDLSEFSKVRLAARPAAKLGPVHLLINNAGVMATGAQRTGDGLDLQMATNYFGHFVLTGLLLPQLADSGAGRVVNVSSNAHRRTRDAPVSDPRLPGGVHSRWGIHARSKLANLLFTYELERRLRAGDLPVQVMAAHPGHCATTILAAGRTGRRSGGIATLLNIAVKATAQSPAMGAWPILMAATADLPGGTYCGPRGRRQLRGRPKVVTSSKLSHDRAAQTRLWDISTRTTGLHYP
jgi:NAD(P)-dependent dehydrogenase (short-subunit alcohol dehydrogenase family)